jgi:hypothetical protein
VESAAAAAGTLAAEISAGGLGADWIARCSRLGFGLWEGEREVRKGEVSVESDRGVSLLPLAGLVCFRRSFFPQKLFFEIGQKMSFRSKKMPWY